MSAPVVVARAFDERLAGRRWLALCPKCSGPVYGPTRVLAVSRALHHHAVQAVQPELFGLVQAVPGGGA